MTSSWSGQRVKISGEVSNWSTINRGVPQGSVLGPLLFNLFLNDLFFVKLSGKIANYADDNHLYNKNECIENLKVRRQRVKISGDVSNWSTINRGVPQGSVLGPLLFNLFLNDLFFVKLSGKIANYADDNHLYNKNECIENLKIDLVNDANAAVTWFHENHMIANPDKFQCIMLSRNGGCPFPFRSTTTFCILLTRLKSLV